MSDAIILFSHGSVLCGAGQNLLELARYMRERGNAPTVEPGYLNYSEPRFEETFRQCVAQGATRITIVPYFLVAGKFVKDDLPQQIAAMQAAATAACQVIRRALDEGDLDKYLIADVKKEPFRRLVR